MKLFLINFCLFLSFLFVNQAMASDATWTCVDTDGGMNLYTKGQLSGVNIFGESFYEEDHCDENEPSSLIEWYCGDTSGLPYTFEKNDCNRAGCLNGACLSSSRDISIIDVYDNVRVVVAKMKYTGVPDLSRFYTKFIVRENDSNGPIICDKWNEFYANQANPMKTDGEVFDVAIDCLLDVKTKKYYIKVQADWQNDVQEVNEDNNIKEVVIGSLPSQTIPEDTEPDSKTINNPIKTDSTEETNLNNVSNNTSSQTSSLSNRVNNKIDLNFTKRLAGKIVLQVEDNGEAWYLNPKNNQRYYLGRPEDAFRVMREQSIGISNKDINKIPVATNFISGLNNIDSDGDGYSDYDEMKNGYNPYGAGRTVYNSVFANQQKGKILLQVESHGEAWYVNPENGLRYYLGRPADAFNIMRSLGLGISNEDISKIPTN